MTSALVPESFDEFRSVKFWDGFFEERGNKAFEWYGDWRQLKPFLNRDCLPRKEVLVVGCGNSDLSAKLYDNGCQNITNLDFSKLVIANMMRRNLRQRPKMKWKVGDMTDMKFADESFQIIIDKGGLDALMGEESEESQISGKQLLDGVSRILQIGGVYICFTLAQSHVLRLLLAHFRRGWLVELHAVPPTPDMAHSAMQPMYVRAEKMAPGRKSRLINVCTVMRSCKAPNAEQLNEICQVVEATSSSVLEEKQGPQTVMDPGVGIMFEKLSPGRRTIMPLVSIHEAHTADEEYRFTAMVLDVKGDIARSAAQRCCIFLIPQGWESKWLFASEEGQWQVAAQCRCSRVILIVMGRSNQFSNLAAVQQELSPIVQPMVPLDLRGIAGAVPIMTAQEGIGRRRVLADVQSTISGRIVVEDIAVEDGEEPSFARRMVFVGNSNLIQSEACLRPTARAAACTNTSRTKSIAKSSKDHQSNTSDFPNLEIDHSVLTMEYHKHIVGGIISSTRLKPGKDSRQYSALIIGLGGGGLPVFLTEYLGLRTEVVELDEEVVSLAMQHFGCLPGADLQVRLDDGLRVVDTADARSLDVLVVDAGSGDASLAMSCPPAAFLEQKFLKKAAAALKPNGLLAVNCVTRSEQAFKSAVQKLQAVFAEVSCSDVKEDVNRVLFAAKSNSHQQQLLAPAVEDIKDAFQRMPDSTETQQLLDDLSCLQLKAA